MILYRDMKTKQNKKNFSIPKTEQDRIGQATQTDCLE